MKKIIYIFFLFPAVLSAQLSEEGPIKAVIQKLFNGMRAGDSVLIRSAFYKEAVLLTALVTKTNDTVLRKKSAEEFIQAAGVPHKETWNEVIWSYDIKTDGLMASAWCPYTFYLGDKLSHCGTNVFLFFKSKEEWKIVSVMDTRQKEKCREK